MAARAHWTSRLGFILAAAGSAVGLGNIWKFPYMTGENGGGAFVLVYLLCVLGVGLPILIAEKTGPHFAVGDTCYSWAEDVKVYNPDGKEIIARDNSISILRKEDPSKAYFQCHTDITIPYDELGSIVVVAKDGTETEIIRDGRFVLPGTEILNEPLN